MAPAYQAILICMGFVVVGIFTLTIAEDKHSGFAILGMFIMSASSLIAFGIIIGHYLST